MIKGIYSAASGMTALETRQATIANNIANASTPGFKSSHPVQLGFYDVFMRSPHNPFHYNVEAAPGGGVKIVETHPDLAAGPLRVTDNPLDVALIGPGYLAVETAQGERFTRHGGLGIDVDGHLATQEGHKVLSDTGAPLDVRGGVVNIASDGEVRVDGVPSGRLRIVEFEAPHRLQRQGAGLYAASEELAATPAAVTQVEQHALEMSNVNIASEMMRMIQGTRAYEANQRVIVTFDDTLGKLIDQVGMPR